MVDVDKQTAMKIHKDSVSVENDDYSIIYETRSYSTKFKSMRFTLFNIIMEL